MKNLCNEHAADDIEWNAALSSKTEDEFNTWARMKSLTHTQIKCAGCGKYKIWRPKPGVREKCVLGNSFEEYVGDTIKAHKGTLSMKRTALHEVRCCGCAKCLRWEWELERLCSVSGQPGNQKISSEEMTAIRTMDDFDLIMLVSEIHDHGWPIAQGLIPLIIKATCARRQRNDEHRESAQ